MRSANAKVYSIPRRMSTVFSASRLTIRLVDTPYGAVFNQTAIFPSPRLPQMQ
jgi:hypothetical protein